MKKKLPYQFSIDRGIDRVSKNSVLDKVSEFVETRAQELCDDLPEPSARSIRPGRVPAVWEIALKSNASLASRPDRRSPERFRSEVLAWEDACSAAADSVVEDFFFHTLEGGALVIRNESERFLENVRVEVAFPAACTVLVAPEPDGVDRGEGFGLSHLLPDEPRKYGTESVFGFDGLALSPFRDALESFDSDVEIKKNRDGHVVSWYVGNLRPAATVKCDEEFRVYVDVDPGTRALGGREEDSRAALPTEIRCAWSLTAQGVDHVFRGELTIAPR